MNFLKGVCVKLVVRWKAVAVAQERLEHLLKVNVLTPNCVDETFLKVDSKVSGFAKSLKDIIEHPQFILI